MRILMFARQLVMTTHKYTLCEALLYRYNEEVWNRLHFSEIVYQEVKILKSFLWFLWLLFQLR